MKYLKYKWEHPLKIDKFTMKYIFVINENILHSFYVKHSGEKYYTKGCLGHTYTMDEFLKKLPPEFYTFIKEETKTEIFLDLL